MSFPDIVADNLIRSGYAVLHGDYRLLFSAPERYERITRAEVLEVARAVFVTERRTTGKLMPLPEVEAA